MKYCDEIHRRLLAAGFSIIEISMIFELPCYKIAKLTKKRTGNYFKIPYQVNEEDIYGMLIL